MRIVRGALLVAAYALVVGWLTWPLAEHLGTHLPDVHIAARFDALLAGFAAVHETRALLHAPTTLFDAPIYHPARHTLLYCEAGFGALPLFLPAFVASQNPTLALNLTFLLAVALTAAMLHAVVARWTGSTLGGALAAWTFLMTRWTLWRFAPTAPNYAVLFYLPLIMLLAATPARRLRESLRLVPLIVLQSLTSVVYLAVASFAPLGVLGVLRLGRRATRAAGLRLLATLAIAAAILAPLLYAIARVRATNRHLEWQSLWVAVWPKVSQPALKLPWSPFRDPISPVALPATAFLLIGVGALSLLLRGRAARAHLQPWVHGALWAVTGFTLSLTPLVYWYGRPVHLPQVQLAHWVPAVTALRVPARIAIAALMGLALLVGAAFAECARRLERLPWARALTVLLAAVLALAMYGDAVPGRRERESPREPIPTAYPLQAVPALSAPLAAALAANPGPLVELPIPGLGIEPIAHAAAMYRAIYHRHPILNGYCGYWPKHFQRRMVTAGRLPAPDALESLRRDTGLTTILVHGANLEKAQRRRWQPVIAGERSDLRLVLQDGEDLLFAVRAD